MKNKLIKLEVKLAKLEQILRTKNDLIVSFEQRISNRNPKNIAEFRELKKIIKNYGRLIISRNWKESEFFKEKFNCQKLRILIKNKHEKMTRDSWYEFVQFIESEKIESLMPFNWFQVHFINSAYLRLIRKTIKFDWIKTVLFPKAKGAKKKYLELQLKKLSKSLEIDQEYITNLKSTFASKYHAKLISRLEKNFKNKTRSLAKKSKNVIELKTTTKYYNNGTIAVKALKNVDLSIKRGEFVVILGPSGSGKTTLLNIISGMDTATYGTTVVARHNLINYNSTQLTTFRRDSIGYVFQQYGLLPNLTVRENVEIGANLQRDKSKQIDIDELLKTIEIYEHRNKFPHELSGGQQQRVSIARSVAKNPEIIFGDEPTGAIDEEMSKQIMQLFVDVNKKFKTTIIIITHNHIFADLATMVVRVANGTVAKITYNKSRKKVDELKWNN